MWIRFLLRASKPMLQAAVLQDQADSGILFWRLELSRRRASSEVPDLERSALDVALLPAALFPLLEIDWDPLSILEGYLLYYFPPLEIDWNTLLNPESYLLHTFTLLEIVWDPLSILERYLSIFFPLPMVYATRTACLHCQFQDFVGFLQEAFCFQSSHGREVNVF